jgi:uncharacterized membrane protein
LELLPSLHSDLWELIHSLPICHHIYERSILFGCELPLCCRCTGIYTSILLGFCLNFALKIGESGKLRVLAVVIGLAMFTGAEAVFEAVFGFDPGNLTRLITGAVSGFSIGIMFHLGVTGLFPRGKGDKHRGDG